MRATSANILQLVSKIETTLTPESSSPSSLSSINIQLDTMATLGEDLLGIVNKLQDLVFNTIGNDSLDLPQIVGFPSVFVEFGTNPR